MVHRVSRAAGVVVPQQDYLLADSLPAVRARRTVVMVMPVVLGQQILTLRIRVRELTLMFAQALADVTGTGDATAVGCHGAPASRFPGIYLGLHLGQMGLALVRKRDTL